MKFSPLKFFYLPNSHGMLVMFVYGHLSFKHTQVKNYPPRLINCPLNLYNSLAWLATWYPNHCCNLYKILAQMPLWFVLPFPSLLSHLKPTYQTLYYSQIWVIRRQHFFNQLCFLAISFAIIHCQRGYVFLYFGYPIGSHIAFEF